MYALLELLNELSCVALMSFAAHCGWSLYERFAKNWCPFLRNIFKRKP